jgi:predicted nucleic acid-binding protein
MITVDASVHVNALNLAEAGSADSKAFLDWLYQRRHPVTSPLLLLVEVAAAIARGQNDADQGLEAMRRLRKLPGHIWLPLDQPLASQSAMLAAHYRLRGADSVYAAVAKRTGATLVTCDRQQMERLRGVVPILSPIEALSRLASPSRSNDPAHAL